MDVTPDKQNVAAVFSSQTYSIDFYQRQYKWNKQPVTRLLDDIFYKFDIEYEKHKSSSLPLESLVEDFSWYYLNTYVTNVVNGKRYIVDGQQRLTTLTLVLIKLMHLASTFGSVLRDWISGRIAGQSGFAKNFWMNHEAHNTTLQSLFDGATPDSIDTSAGITSANMAGNYSIISDYLQFKLTDQRKFEVFTFYFMKRLVLINLNVEQTDVPMVFEVINDRGVRLKPHEILKGMLLGEIEKKELESLDLNGLWERQVALVNEFKEDEIDQFFIYFLRSRFANSVNDSRKYDHDYHRVIFLPETDKSLGLFHNPKNVVSFLRTTFTYYTCLYARIREYTTQPNEGFIHVYYNALNEMDSQILLILAACELEDAREDEKIRIVSYNIDRLFSLLSLQRSYDSNDFNVSIYKLAAELRGKPLEAYQAIFDGYLMQLLSEARGIAVSEPFSYGLFRDTGIELSKRFKRYFFARVEDYIATNTHMSMKHSLYDLVSNTGSVNGFHIEHILSKNKENLDQFQGDEETFERERNRLGGLLLLKGKDNISSSNERYADKLKTYANTLYWNETLRSDSYKSKLDFQDMAKKTGLEFKPYASFGPEELEQRHMLLFEITRIIWK